MTTVLNALMAEIDPNNFLSGGNAGFIAELYGRFLDDPAAVDESWRRFFGEIGDDAAALKAERAGPSWAPRPRCHGSAALRGALWGETIDQGAAESICALNVSHAYRVRA